MTDRPTKSREVVLWCLTQILDKGGQSHTVLSEALAPLAGGKRSDRAFITRVTEGVIERLMTLDAGLDKCSSIPVRDMKPLIREILRLSAYQILYMDRVPDHAAVSEAVDLAKAHGFKGLSGFVNGVLRNVSKNHGAFEFSDPELRYSMPSWIIEKWRKTYGDEKTEQILEKSFDVRPLSVHVMTGRTTVEEVIGSLGAQGVKAERSPLSDRILLLSDCDSPGSLKAFSDGLLYVQDAASSLVGEAADIKKNDLIIDVCAAPGGKSMDAADRLRGTGMVLSRDRTIEKIALLDENKRRLGLTNVITQVWDAACYDERLEGAADIVIADLPCSGLGDIAGKPEIKYRASEEECKKLETLQHDILSVAARYVKPGGKLIYSTCTLNRGENEDQRERLLSESDLHAVPLRLSYTEFSEKETLAQGYLQLLPGIDRSDGFFISVFERG